MSLSYTFSDKCFEWQVADFTLVCLWFCPCVCVFSQAHFSDTEEDSTSRTPVSRQLSSDVKQVRHASQRSKVRGHNTGEFERTAAHNPTDPAICHLSPITVSMEEWLMSKSKTYMHKYTQVYIKQKIYAVGTIFLLYYFRRQTGSLLLFCHYVKAYLNALLLNLRNEVMCFGVLLKSIHVMLLLDISWHVTQWGHVVWSPLKIQALHGYEQNILTCNLMRSCCFGPCKYHWFFYMVKLWDPSVSVSLGMLLLTLWMFCFIFSTEIEVSQI